VRYRIWIIFEFWNLRFIPMQKPFSKFKDKNLNIRLALYKNEKRGYTK
jgi:hypothetical protein